MNTVIRIITRNNSDARNFRLLGDLADVTYNGGKLVIARVEADNVDAVKALLNDSYMALDDSYVVVGYEVMSAVTATIYEAGNGFPDVGDYVPGDDGSLYQVTELGPRIQTGSRSGESNHIPYCLVTLADWSASEEGDEHTARVVLGSDEGA